MRTIVLALTTVTTALLVSACGQGANSDAPPPAQVPQDVRESLRDAPKTPVPAAAASVDVCALLDETDAAAVLGTLEKPPEAKPARGSLLGECAYTGVKGSGSVSAHPADELAGTVEYMGKSKPVQTLSGLGTVAYATQYGVMVQPAGQTYFLSVFIVGAEGPALTEALARKLKL